MKKNSLILLSIVSMLIFLTSCKKSSDDTTDPSNTNIKLPTIETAAVSEIGMTTATVGGNVTSDGGGDISARGICYSLKADPTIADGKTTEGTSSGSFTSVLSGLKNATVYYARAYATNSKGTAYGQTVTFAAFLTGQSYQGGFIVYILQEGDPGYTPGFAHGLIVSPLTSFTYSWTPGDYAVTGASGTALGTGVANTNAIVATLGSSSYAAYECFTQKQQEYSDWFLPSKDELNKLYLVRNKVGGAPHTGYIWSSTDAGGSTAWIQAFDTGVQSTYDKRGKGFTTIAMRSF